MPAFIPSDFPQKSTFKPDEDFGQLYDPLYPDGVNMKPGSKIHEAIKEQILARARASERVMTNYHTRWRETDQTLTAYIPIDDAEQKVQDNDNRRPVSIVIPESYATLETFLTYNMAAFGESPIFKYIGVGPEDVVGSILLEKIVQSQVSKGKALLDLHTQWRDAFAYGVGVISAHWAVKEGSRVVIREIFDTDPITGVPTVSGFEKKVVDSVQFEGTLLNCIDPYKYLPDPDVDFYKVQDAEYVGWLTTDSYAALLRDENSPGSIHMNVRYLENRSGRSGIYQDDPSDRSLAQGGIEPTRGKNEATHKIDTIWMYWDLIPSEWNLSDRDTPEKWVFALSGDEVITAAAPLDLFHNMYPVAVCAPDAGGHELMPMSRLQIMSGMQKAINFMFNSRMLNVRKSLQNLFLVDPKIINMFDAINPHMGKIIRTRKPVWGRGVKDGIEQLQIQDVTAGHMGDLANLRELSRQTTGAVDSIQGVQRSGGERVTAEEFRDTRSGALSKLQKAARLVSMQSMHDLAQIYAYHTQQFMTEDTYVDTAGRWEETLRLEYDLDQRVPVTPFDLNVAFDVEVSDGSLQGGEHIEAWTRLYEVMLAHPETAQGLDATRIFLHMARLMGVKNPQEFLKKGGNAQFSVQPDEEVANNDNLIPLEEAANAR